MTTHPDIETYTRFTCILVAATEDAVQVDISPNVSEKSTLKWIPRSLLHGADDIRLDRNDFGQKIQLRVMDWKAKQLGVGIH
ncbi:MAG: hypothetical protein IH622_23075 [Ochrobactrum anthropi]|uniref:Uncharacterized protein n=1 Tax=Brucella anthropi TaxID=529 RepID=A0A8I0NAQ5_BRUAN|nr:hypothetical protein [Brucella anthropi]MBE0563680.1 hypothetical protein [Brucella anthropi]